MSIASEGVCRLPQGTSISTIRTTMAAARRHQPERARHGRYKRFAQDNDEALGLTVELISNSPCWQDTLIVVVEDDTQNGADHVDGQRSIFLLAGRPVGEKAALVSKTHNEPRVSIFKTVDLIRPIPSALNQR